jgi:hypothetical protein
MDLQSRWSYELRQQLMQVTLPCHASPLGKKIDCPRDNRHLFSRSISPIKQVAAFAFANKDSWEQRESISYPYRCWVLQRKIKLSKQLN